MAATHAYDDDAMPPLRAYRTTTSRDDTHYASDDGDGYDAYSPAGSAQLRAIHADVVADAPTTRRTPDAPDARPRDDGRNYGTAHSHAVTA
jgi:hypothetical protein